MFKFLELPRHELVKKFIEEHTQSEAEIVESWSTVRNSKTRIFLWKKQMEDADIINIQNICKEPMEILGYNPMTNVDENKNDENFTIIVKSAQEIWPTNF